MKSQYECPHNDGVLCAKNRLCQRCGWNPIVAEARKERREQHEQVLQSPVQQA